MNVKPRPIRYRGRLNRRGRKRHALLHRRLWPLDHIATRIGPEEIMRRFRLSREYFDPTVIKGLWY